MKSLFLDCNKFKAKKIIGNIEELCNDCLVILITFESSDKKKHADRIIKEAIKIADKFKRSNIVIAPFAHLSNDLLSNKESLILLDYIEMELRKNFYILVSEFGAEKGLLLDIASKKNNIKFRSY